MKSYKYKNIHKGFTLVELLTSLMVCSIILTAIASLSFAMSTANKGADEITEKQARIRFVQVRLNEIFKNCKMICGSTSDDIAVWTEDADGDNQIDSGEIIYIDTGSSDDSLRLLEFEDVAGSNIRLDQIRDGTVKTWLIGSYLKNDSVLIEGLENISFMFDVSTPRSNFVSIKFDCSGPDSIKTYEICSKLLSDSDYLLDEFDDLLSSDDD